MKKLFIKDYLQKVGSEKHTGWLPENASTPLAIQPRELIFELEIEELENDGGFLLLNRSQNGELYGDTWHRDEQESIESTTDWFDVQSDLWKEIK